MGVVVICVLARVWVDDMCGAGGGGGGGGVDRPSQVFLFQDNDLNHQLPQIFLILDAVQVL